VPGHRQQHCISWQRQAKAARNNIFLKKAAAAAANTLREIIDIFRSIQKLIL